MDDIGSAPPRRAVSALPEDVGARLRKVREERGLSLREVCRRVEITPSALSQIETGRSRPSVGTLYAIVSELDISLDDLFRLPVMDIVPPLDEVPPAGEPGFVQRPDERESIDVGTGVRWERLTRSAEEPADFLFITYDVGTSSTFDPFAARSSGREYGLLLTGRLRVTLDLDEYELGPNDSIVFDTSIPHRIENMGDVPARAVWCMVGRAI